MAEYYSDFSLVDDYVNTNQDQGHQYEDLREHKSNTRRASAPHQTSVAKEKHSNENLKFNLPLKKIIILVAMFTVLTATLSCVFSFAVFAALKPGLINTMFEKFNEKTQGCGSAPEVFNSTSTITSTQAGQMAMYKCKDGFRTEGNPIIFCQQNGTWSEVVFFCKRVCGSAPEVINSISTIRSTQAGQMATYRCKDGFRTEGDPIIFCQQNGSWSEVLFFCKRAFTMVTFSGRISTKGVIDIVPLIFNDVQVSTGTGYNVSDGKFYAPYRGWYLFDVYVHAYKSMYADAYLVKNNDDIMYINSGRTPSDSYPSSSRSITINLKTTDTVWVRGAGHKYSPLTSLTITLLNVY